MSRNPSSLQAEKSMKSSKQRQQSIKRTKSKVSSELLDSQKKTSTARSHSKSKNEEMVTFNPLGGQTWYQNSFLHMPTRDELQYIELAVVKNDPAFKYNETGYKESAYFDQKDLDVGRIKQLAEMVLQGIEIDASKVMSDDKIKKFFKNVVESQKPDEPTMI